MTMEKYEMLPWIGLRLLRLSAGRAGLKLEEVEAAFSRALA